MGLIGSIVSGVALVLAVCSFGLAVFMVVKVNSVMNAIKELNDNFQNLEVNLVKLRFKINEEFFKLKESLLRLYENKEGLKNER